MWRVEKGRGAAGTSSAGYIATGVPQKSRDDYGFATGRRGRAALELSPVVGDSFISPGRRNESHTHTPPRMKLVRLMQVSSLAAVGALSSVNVSAEETAAPAAAAPSP